MTSKGYHKLSVREKEQKEEENKTQDDSTTGSQPKKFSRRYKILFGLLIVLMFGVGVTVGIVLRQKTGKIKMFIYLNYVSSFLNCLDNWPTTDCSVVLTDSNLQCSAALLFTVLLLLYTTMPIKIQPYT